MDKKYRVNDLAKDLNVSTNDITEVDRNISAYRRNLRLRFPKKSFLLYLKSIRRATR